MENMSDNKTDAEKKLLKSSLEGQKQLMKFGESLAIQKQIDERRIDKDEKIGKYIENLEIVIPEGLKNQDYINSMRDFYESNKTFIEKYRTVQTFVTSPKDYDEKKILEDMMNLYYGYKLKEQFRKKIEKELEKEKESHKKTQDSFNDLAIECSDREEDIEKLELIKYKYECIMIGLVTLLFISNLVLSIYLHYGPESLYDDTLALSYNIGYCFFLIWLMVKNIIDFTISMYTDVPEYVRCLYFITVIILSVLAYYHKISFGMVQDNFLEGFNFVVNLSKKLLIDFMGGINEKLINFKLSITQKFKKN